VKTCISLGYRLCQSSRCHGGRHEPGNGCVDGRLIGYVRLLKTVKAWILEKYMSSRDALRTALTNAPAAIHISFEPWTSPKQRSFFAIFGHHVSLKAGRAETSCLVSEQRQSTSPISSDISPPRYSMRKPWSTHPFTQWRLSRRATIRKHLQNRREVRAQDGEGSGVLLGSVSRAASTTICPWRVIMGSGWVS